MATEQTYDEIVRENEDLLLRNSELELENSILRENREHFPVPVQPPFSKPVPPPSPPPPPPPPPPPSPKDEEEIEDDLGSKVNVQLDLSEGAKIVKVKTDRGKLMYTVSFLANPDGTFIVKVWKFGNLVVPVEIVRREYGEDRKEDAATQFRKLKNDYINLVKAETSTVDPRKIFDDCVEYRITDPDCCGNCRFCVKEELPEKKLVRPRKPRSICVNRKNIAQYERVLRGYCATFFAANAISGDAQPPDTGFPGDKTPPDFEFSELPLQTYHNPQPLNPLVPPVEIDMRVIVEPKGICNGYERGSSPPSSQRYDDPKSFEFDKDLMVIIGNMVDDRVNLISQEDVIVYCGDSEDTSGRR